MRVGPLETNGSVNGIERLVDPGLLRLLLAITETRGFANAAQVLGVTQPSVSQQVKRIEQFVGRPLFRRTRRGAELTADGEAVIIYARAMLGLTSDLRQRLDRLDAGVEVATAMSEDFCRTALPTVLRLFVLDHPHVRLRIVSGTYETLTAAIENRTVDFAIMRRYDRFPDAEPLFHDQLAWFGGLGLRLPVADPIPLVVPLPPNPTRSTILDCLRAAGRSSIIRFESIGVAGMEMALGAHLGVCAGPRGMALLGVAPLPDGHGLPPLPRVEFVMVRAGRALSDAAHAFARVLADAARSRFELESHPIIERGIGFGTQDAEGSRSRREMLRTPL